jgi:hypothetical protein
MPLNHSEDTHQQLLAKLPQVTGKPFAEWAQTLEQSPGLLRFEERVNWLRIEHGIAHGHATAIVHELDMRRAQRSFS